MSIYKELKPEIKALLEADRKEYPNMVKAMIDEMEGSGILGSYTGVMDISVNTASHLLGYLGQTDLKPPSDDFVLKVYFIFGR